MSEAGTSVEKLTFDLDASTDLPTNAHAKAGRRLYNVIDWSGSHRGQIALTPEEHRAVALIQPTPAETEAGELDASRAIVDAWCDRYANGMPPVTARDKLATDILALVKRSPTPPPIGDGEGGAERIYASINKAIAGLDFDIRPHIRSRIAKAAGDAVISLMSTPSPDAR